MRIKNVLLSPKKVKEELKETFPSRQAKISHLKEQVKSFYNSNEEVIS
jgi:hypothetical protein